MSDKKGTWFEGYQVGQRSMLESRNKALEEAERLRGEVEALRAASVALADALALERYGDPADTGFRHIAELSHPLAIKLLDEAKAGIEEQPHD